MNWDDYRIFLEISKAGGLKKAARNLKMHHSSCARRLGALEDKLRTRLFDRLPGGYVLTDDGRNLARSMQIVQDEFSAIERTVYGKDTRLEGPLKLSLTNGLALHLLMPAIHDFTALYPAVDLQINMTYQFSDLAKREADVSIRHAKDPPQSLAGPRAGRIYWSAYASRDYLSTHNPGADPQDCHWLGWGPARDHLKWPGKKSYPDIPVRADIYSEVLQLTGAQTAMGIASLPCFIGDAAPDLVRLPKLEPEPGEWLWLLAHPDMIRNARVKALIDHLERAIREQKPLLEGRAAD